MLALSMRNLKVKCLVRKPQTSSNPDITYVVGDVLDYDSLVAATSGIDTVYYFIHMMGDQPKGQQEKFDVLDTKAINNMIEACRRNSVKRIIHLTGIRNDKEILSHHLKSRKEVEDIIKSSGIDYTVFRASVIIGRGGAAFEILDTAVRKFPIIPVLDWENTRVQPISIDDVIKYLVECLEKNETINRCFDIGGPQVINYKELMKEYANHLGLNRIFIRIPGSWHWISSFIMGKISPVHPNIAYWLIESLQNNMVGEPNNLNIIFGFAPAPLKESISRAVG